MRRHGEITMRLVPYDVYLTDPDLWEGLSAGLEADNTTIKKDVYENALRSMDEWELEHGEPHPARRHFH